MKYTLNYNLRKPERTDVVNINDFNANADIIDAELTPVADPTQAPESNGPGKVFQWISWLTNRIQAITGKADWFETPDISLADAKTHMDAPSPHRGHVLTSDVATEPAPNKILKLDTFGKFSAAIISGLSAIATSGNYNDLLNVPVTNRVTISASSPIGPALNDFWIDIN